MNRVIWTMFMGSFISRLSLDLVLAVEANNELRSADENKRVGTRTGRSVNTPAPIDCRLKPWSAWTTCEPCKTKKHRFRYLEQPGQFRGTACHGSQWEESLCPAQACKRQSLCGNKFTCPDSGRCISQQLLCNVDYDCEDGTDEDECEEVTEMKKCSGLLSIPGSMRAAQGYNVLTGDFVDPVVDPGFYGGTCEYVYNGEWRKLTYDAFCERLSYDDAEKHYRKPYNFNSYRFMAHAATDGSSEYYEDAAGFLRSRREENSFNMGVTVGLYDVEVGLSGSQSSVFLHNVSQYSSQDLGFVTLVSKVQTAQFKMRSSGLVLSESMHRDLLALPETYDFGTYARFINQYGTHYVTQGAMGGVMEYVAVVKKSAIQKSEITAKDLGWCFGASLGLAMVEEVSLKVKGDVCKKTGSFDKAQDSSSSYVEDVVKLVRGGTTGGSAGLLPLHDSESYRKWGLSLKANPVLVEFETLPIFELVRASTAASAAQGRLPHLRRAWQEYLGEFSVCRCAPCRNNGVALLSGTSCSCVCKEGYTGVACEETMRKGVTDGAWSCWSPWSPCVSGTQTRTRACNRPAPAGGDDCLGKASQTQRC